MIKSLSLRTIWISMSEQNYTFTFRYLCSYFSFFCIILVDSWNILLLLLSEGWRGGATDKAFGLAINRSRVQILLEVTLRNNLRQAVYTFYVPLSLSSITWYQPKGGDALRLGR